jgi:hypothetical protein
MTPHLNPALERACVAVGWARNIKTAMNTILSPVKVKPSYKKKPIRNNRTARVSPLPVACNRVKKSGNRRSPIVAVVKKKRPPTINNIANIVMIFI